MKLPFYFYKADPNDYIVKFISGIRKAAGKGRVFFVWPWTTLARVPTTDQLFPFMLTELTADGQEIDIQGELQVRFLTDQILERRDFSIDPRNNMYKSDDPHKVQGEAVNTLQTYFRHLVQIKRLRDNLVSMADLEREVLANILENTEPFTRIGVKVVGLFVTLVTPTNRDLKRALEAEAREKMLAAADKAVHDRRMDAAKSDRALKEYETETAMQVEKKTAELIEVKNANKVKEAEADAEAIAKRLAPYANVDSRMLLALGIKELAGGRVGQVNFTPDFLAALTSAVKGS